MLDLHLQPIPDAASASELRAAVVAARHLVQDVLAARARTAAVLRTWHGPHRDRYDHDATTLATSGRALVAGLDDLLRALDHELRHAHAGTPGRRG